MSSLLVENVVVDGRSASIVCREGCIASIEAPAQAPMAATGAQFDDWLDGQGCIVTAPLINCHTHAAMTLFRGRGDDLALMPWLRTRIWPYEAVISEEEVYAGTRLAILEMVRNGTVFFNDMYWAARGTARAVEEMGVRACIGEVLVDPDTPAAAHRRWAELERVLDELGGYSNRISASVTPHAIYTVSEQSLRWCHKQAEARQIPLHIHLAETDDEVKNCYATHGCSPVSYLDRLGLLGERTIAAHTACLSDADAALLGDRRVVCVHNPISNMKLAVGGTYPYGKLSGAGAVCAIGSDGAASNNSLDLFEEMKVAALLQKFANKDPSALPAAEALALAQANPASVFDLPSAQIEAGRVADFILVDSDQPALWPSHSLTSDLVYAADGGVVDSVVCDGQVIMRHRHVEGEREIRCAARTAAEQLFARVDG